ncbi:MAG: YCF48-related protein, partial [Desulfatibacillaceae bacterium]|nr:YCF48-related protein [Desulfatibacillaceae bacterium]
LNRDEAWAVGDEGTIIHTDNGGASWYVQGAGQVPEAPYQGVFALDKNRIWVTGGPDPEDGVIVYSQNGGATWEEYDFQGGLHVYCFVPRLLQSGVGWISGHNRVVYHTTDFGQTWEAYQHLDLPSGTDLNNVVAINDTTAWVAADMGIIFYTTDGNKTWHMQRPACAAGFYLMGVDAMDTRTIWMAGATSGGPSDAGVIIHTQNAGEQWVRQHTPTNVRYWDIAFAR